MLLDPDQKIKLFGMPVDVGQPAASLLHLAAQTIAEYQASILPEKAIEVVGILTVHGADKSIRDPEGRVPRDIYVKICEEKQLRPLTGLLGLL